MWTNGVHVCFMFLKHRNGGGNQVDGGGGGCSLMLSRVERDVMENRVELSPAASTTSATVCVVLFVILICSDILKKRRVWLYSDESVQMQILDRMCNNITEWSSWGIDRRSVTQMTG